MTNIKNNRDRRAIGSQLEEAMLQELCNDLYGTCTNLEIIKGREIIDNSTPFELFNKIRDVYRRIPSNDGYNRLYNVFQRWSHTWRQRFTLNNFSLPYETGGVMPA